jgi:hypothetical protein
MQTGFWWEDQKERDHYEDPDIDTRIILKWINKKQDGVNGLCSRQVPVAGS